MDVEKHPDQKSKLLKTSRFGVFLYAQNAQRFFLGANLKDIVDITLIIIVSEDVHIASEQKQ